MKQVEIIGGGLAGLSLGHALVCRGVPTTIIEAGDYPRHRVCGEFIAGLDVETREQLVLDRFLGDAPRLSRITWYRRGRPLAEHRLALPAQGISRSVLDARIARAFVAGGGILKLNTRGQVHPDRPGQVIASGRQPAASAWLGIKAHVRGLATTGDLEVHLGRANYFGLSSVGDGVVNVCGLVRRDAVSGGRGRDWFVTQLEKSGHPVLAERIRGADLLEDSIVSVAGLDFTGGERRDDLLRLGDSITAIPPFTGHGMALAFQSAAAALPYLHAWATGRVGWRETVLETRREFQLRAGRCIRVARLLHPWLLSSPRQKLFALAQRSGIVPLNTFARMVHQ